MEEIKIYTVAKDDHLRIDVVMIKVDENLIETQRGLSFKITNIISSLMEAHATTWIQDVVKTNVVPFYLKVKSDSNKEQWARILKSAFGANYPWTLVIAKVANEVESYIRNIKQDFQATEIEAKPCTWLLEPFIQEDMINTIFGMGSSGKTLLSLYFAKLICQNKDSGNILFVDYEDTQGGWKEKLDKIMGIAEIETSLDRFYYYQSEQIPLVEQVDKVREVIKKRNIKLVILDSASLATGESTSDEKAAVRLVSALKLLKTTVLLIAHQRKNDGDKTPIGSIQYENQSRNVWNVKGTPDEEDNRVIHIACTHTKANNTYIRKDPWGYRIEYTPESIKIIGESAIGYFGDKFSITERIKTLLKDEGEFDYKGVAEALGISPSSANKHLSLGKKRGIFSTKNGVWNIA